MIKNPFSSALICIVVIMFLGCKDDDSTEEIDPGLIGRWNPEDFFRLANCDNEEEPLAPIGENLRYQFEENGDFYVLNANQLSGEGGGEDLNDLGLIVADGKFSTDDNQINFSIKTNSYEDANYVSEGSYNYKIDSTSLTIDFERVNSYGCDIEVAMYKF